MRINKLLPFFMALFIHIIPLGYLLLIKPKTLLSNPTFVEIDLKNFSFTQSTFQKIKPSKKQTEIVGLPTKGTASPVGLNSIGLKGESTNNKNEPSFIRFQDPRYPPVARQKGLEGHVKIKAYYNQEGKITKVDIIESSGVTMLDEAVRKSAIDWLLSTSSAGSFEKVFVFKLNN